MQMQRRRLSARAVTVTQTGARGGGGEQCKMCRQDKQCDSSGRKGAHQRTATVNQDCLANCEEEERREEKTRAGGDNWQAQAVGTSIERHQSGTHQLGDSWNERQTYEMIKYNLASPNKRWWGICKVNGECLKWAMNEPETGENEWKSEMAHRDWDRVYFHWCLREGPQRGEKGWRTPEPGSWGAIAKLAKETNSEIELRRRRRRRRSHER